LIIALFRAISTPKASNPGRTVQRGAAVLHHAGQCPQKEKKKEKQKERKKEKKREKKSRRGRGRHIWPLFPTAGFWA